MNYSENTTISTSTIESTKQIKVRKHLFTGNEKHDISLDDASRFTKRYRDSVPADAMKGGYFGKMIFEQILAQVGCVGIRSYFANYNNGSQTFVLVGVENNGNDLWQGVLGEDTLPCPPYCGAFNPLNSSPEDRVMTMKRTTKIFTGQENHQVTLAEASNYSRNFREGKNLEDVKAVYFGRNIYEKILSQAGCVGLRLYFAVDDSGLTTLVVTGVRADGTDIYDGFLGEDTLPCPPYCGALNPLNG